ncbi:hypothetical protein ABHF91_14400 [Pseudaeromonas sp. ZJS20]|uniref:hypothetical protein n=1 Tax=Pseudaeromonas aegiceratis TaxID=3153928 RepID=UPI00390CA6DF
MPRWKLGACALLYSLSLYANDSFNSELSHFAGGAAMAGGISLITQHYYPEQDAFWMGFGLSSLAGILGEGTQWASGGRFSVLDAGSHMAGSLLGAVTVDHFCVSPDLYRDGEHYVGLQVRYLL